MRAWLLLSLLAVVPARAVELVRANASESAVRADGAVAFVERYGDVVRLAWRDTRGAVHAIDTSGTPDTPAWSPSGESIAYATMEGENSNLVVLELASGRTRYVAPTSDSEMHPFFAPGGEKLVYTRYVSGTAGDAELRLFEFDLRPGGADVPLLRGAPASYGSWSPDGRWLLYWRFVDGENAEIAVSRGDGSEQRALTHDPAFDGWPSWSPDGRFIAFARERGDDADILVVPFAGGDACVVAGGAGRKTSPKWSSDGRALYFDRSSGGRTDLLRADVPAACVSRAR